jgi:hypothetical protein
MSVGQESHMIRQTVAVSIRMVHYYRILIRGEHFWFPMAGKGNRHG